MIFTTANNSPNLARCLLMAFSDIEMRKEKFSEKTVSWRARQHCAKTLWSLLKVN